MAQVSLREVTKSYPGNIKAVDKVNLGIENKEFVVLIALESNLTTGYSW